MDETTYIKLIVAQLTTLRNQAFESLGEDHRVSDALDEALTSIGGVTRERVVPEGFADEATYTTFLRDQVEQVFEGQDFDAVADNVADVVGVVPDADGNLVEVGNIDTATAALNEQIAAVEEEEGPIETDNAITITYTRIDGNALTDEDVRTIINHPVSAPLRNLGNIQLVDIEATDDLAVRKAVFAVLEEGKLSLKGLALGAVGYRGVQPFPGLGRVQAVGSVNFA